MGTVRKAALRRVDKAYQEVAAQSRQNDPEARAEATRELKAARSAMTPAEQREWNRTGLAR